MYHSNLSTALKNFEKHLSNWKQPDDSKKRKSKNLLSTDNVRNSSSNQEVNHENTSIQKDERCYFSTEISQTKLIANKGLVTNNLKCIKGGDRRLKTNKNKMKNDFMMSLQKKISQMTNSSNIQIFSNNINMVDESNNACFTTGGIKGNFSNTPHPQPKIMFSR